MGLYLLDASEWSCGGRAHLGCRWPPRTPAWPRPRLRPAGLPPVHLIMRWIISRCFPRGYERRCPPPRATHLAERSPAVPPGSCDGGGWRRACRLKTGKKNRHQIVWEEVNLSNTFQPTASPPPSSLCWDSFHLIADIGNRDQRWLIFTTARTGSR